jgi:hypothetical protein
MRLVRFLLALLAAAAFVVAAGALAAEVWAATSGRAAFTTPLGELWFDLDKNSLLLLQPAIERHLHPWLWGGIVQPLLERPPIAAAGAFAALGLALAGLGRLLRRRR